MILPTSRMAGKFIDVNKIAESIGLSKKQIQDGASQLSQTHPLFRKEANIKLARTPNIFAALKTAQQDPKQTMPLDIEDYVDSGVPRDKSVGLKQHEPKTIIEVMEKDNGPGSSDGGHSNVVPRSKGNDGVGGKKTTFSPENGVKQTSKNPDKYVQTLVEQLKPTPAGNKENHAVASSEREVIEAFASSNNIVNKRDIEMANIGPFYIIAHKDKAFKLVKDGYNGHEIQGTYIANFKNIQIIVKGTKKNKGLKCEECVGQGCGECNSVTIKKSHQLKHKPKHQPNRSNPKSKKFRK
jgi:hypothetical protein